MNLKKNAIYGPTGKDVPIYCLGIRALFQTQTSKHLIYIGNINSFIPQEIISSGNKLLL